MNNILSPFKSIVYLFKNIECLKIMNSGTTFAGKSNTPFYVLKTTFFCG